MKKYLLLCYLCLVFNTSNACCLCSELPTREAALDQTDLVVTARILSSAVFSAHDRELTGLVLPQRKYTVKTVFVHKGKLQNKILTVISSLTDCGYKFETGKTYTIYASAHPQKKGGTFLHTSSCTRTAQFNLYEFNKIMSYCKSKGYS